MSNEIIGKVTATERSPSTCTKVRFWVKENIIIRPFDIVKIENLSRFEDRELSFSYAIIKDLNYVSDSGSDLANYVSSDFGDVSIQPLNSRLGTTIAIADILYNDQEVEMPIREGSMVCWASADEIRKALGIEEKPDSIPAGYMQMSNGEEVRVTLRASYLIGPEAAHLNIAGISGLATKTSYAMFLLGAIQQKLSNQVSMIVFNVKGTDVLSIDTPSSEPDGTEDKGWEKCGLAPLPFQNVKYLYPFSEKRAYHAYTHLNQDIVKQQQEDGKSWNYFYDVERGLKRLPLLFSDVDDPSSSLDHMLHQLDAESIGSWDSLKEQIGKMSEKGSKSDVHIAAARKYKRLINTRTSHDIFCERAHGKERRHKLIEEAIEELRAGEVLVIDVEPLPDYLQCLVFGDVIETLYQIKLGSFESSEGETSDQLGRVIVFADELNKYAPKGSEKSRSLTGSILEVTERGRSLGVSLFGAEQFRSGVHDRVLGNCSTNVFGRTSSVELNKCADYKYLPDAFQGALTMLPQGTLMLQHAVFKTSLIKIHFPYPCYYQPKGGNY